MVSNPSNEETPPAKAITMSHEEYQAALNEAVGKAVKEKFHWSYALTVAVIYACLAFSFSGCTGSGGKEVSTANAIPAVVQSYEVPIADTSTIPDMLYLRPGQSAIVMDDLVGVARIPAEGNELYTGPVVISKGTIVIRPKVEQ